MKLYPIPGGAWAGTEADWKTALKARGLNPKEFEATKTKEVPTGKKELMEFLTFYAVDVYRTGGAAPSTTVPAVDVEALRALHNPEGAAPIAVVATQSDNGPSLSSMPTGTLQDMFYAAPIKVQAELAVGFIDRLTT